VKAKIATVVFSVVSLAAASVGASDRITIPSNPTWIEPVGQVALMYPADPTWRPVGGRATGYDADDPAECTEVDDDGICLKFPVDPTWSPVRAAA